MKILPTALSCAAALAALPSRAAATDASVRPGALTAQPTVSPDVLEPSVRNEVDHARARAASAATGVWTAADAAFARLYETNGLTATDAAIRLVSAQRPDGRWLAGTNDVTAAALRVLDRLAGKEGAP